MRCLSMLEFVGCQVSSKVEGVMNQRVSHFYFDLINRGRIQNLTKKELQVFDSQIWGQDQLLVDNGLKIDRKPEFYHVFFFTRFFHEAWDVPCLSLPSHGIRCSDNVRSSTRSSRTWRTTEPSCCNACAPRCFFHDKKGLKWWVCDGLWVCGCLSATKIPPKTNVSQYFVFIFNCLSM